MGQKVNPNGFRLGIIRDWDCRWFDASPSMAAKIKEDWDVRNYVFARLKRQKAAIARIVIERTMKHMRIHIYTARPGIVVGRSGEEVATLSREITKLTGKEVKVDVVEIRKPEIEAQLVADNIAAQLEGRVAFKRSVKQAMQQAERAGCQGIKVQVSGRLGGIEIARTEHYKWGKVPLHTIRANIDYAESTAFTVTGTVGVKTWIYKGESIVQKIDAIEEEEKQKMKDRRQSGRMRTRPNGRRQQGGRGKGKSNEGQKTTE